MFTGIIETVGKVTGINKSGSNVEFMVSSSISHKLSTDQSVSHDGVCLTVTKVEGTSHCVTAINETLERSSLQGWQKGQRINLERCMKANGRYDGHIVQGHVDAIAKVISIESRNGSWLFQFELEKEGLMVEKGSVCLNGVSLTCFDIRSNKFSAAIIPYTFKHTNINRLQPGSIVNIEFDIVGKYICRILNKRDDI